MRLRILVPALVACAVPAVPAAAGAATLDLEGAGTSLAYTATPGERNTLTTIQETPTTIRLRDRVGITLTAASVTFCSHVTPTEVRCRRDPFPRLNLRLGDGNDLATPTASTPTTVFGGEGDDLLVAGTGAGRSSVRYFGGDGADTASYASATAPVLVDVVDTLTGDGRPALGDRDEIRDGVETVVGSRFADRLGGPVTVSYAARTVPVTAIVNGGPISGEAGEGDRLVGLKGVIGGRAGDVLSAIAPDTSTGFTLDGGPGTDAVQGGAGPDTVRADDGEADALDCGGGRDVFRRDAGETSVVNCELNLAELAPKEHVVVGSLALAPATLRAGRDGVLRVRLRWSHPRSWRQLRSVELRLRRAGRTVGSVVIRPHGRRLEARGALRLGRGSAVRTDGRGVTARLALRLSAPAAAGALSAEIVAVDRAGRRQVETVA